MLNRKSIAVRGISLLLLILVWMTAQPVHLAVQHVHAAPSVTIDRPWKPVLIGNNTIRVGDIKSIYCNLQEGKRYHIFLVGDWVNPSNPRTDYDIFVYPPTGLITTHTEATGLPEQVANDAAKQFYVPKVSGTYRFDIHNDLEDTKNSTADPAIFMIIEHIETDKRYSASLMGRLLPSDPQSLLSTVAYEFTTSATNFTVVVDTPEDIDMFEARLYPMASPPEVGYDIRGLPTPSGGLLNGTIQGIYGGYNTTIKGYRPASLMASCERMGEKMEIRVGGGTNSTGSQDMTTYFLVLIAEYSRSASPSDVPFYIRTNTTAPQILVASPTDRVSSDNFVQFKCGVTSPHQVKKVWLNFTINDLAREYAFELQREGDYYAVDVPSFMPGDKVSYTIYAEDEIGNLGRLDSSFRVKARTETSLYVWSLSKPWNPLKIANNTIQPGEIMEVSAVLEEGKTYHIFLVGDWVNPANNGTDYDIIVQGPSVSETYTEATGYPEQVSNDGKGQYFVAPKSGIYRFMIENDIGNSARFPSNNALPAVFMVIEHIKTDKRYTSSMRGREIMTSTTPLESTQVYEFTTSAASFTVYVDTPDDIDMFEARVYPMADGVADGHLLNGIPTPSGDALNGTVSGDFGGFNTTVEGYRNLAYTATCVGMGQKMKIDVNRSGNSTSPTSYFLILIAEYSKTSTPSVVPFYIKTSCLKPKVALNGTIGDVFAGEPTKVSAIVSSPHALESVWMNFTVNGIPRFDTVYLSKVGGLYEGAMPPFAARDTVAWSICAEDEIGNLGRIDSSFRVKARTETSLYVSKGNVAGGDTLEVTGQTTLAGAKLNLNFTSGSFKEIIPVKADQLGGYKYTYLPKQPGSWSVSAKFDGDDSTYPSKSLPASFTMTPVPTTIRVALDSQEIKVNQVLLLTGKTTPAVQGIAVDIILSSTADAKTETLTTGPDGSFSYATSLLEGEWDVVAQVRGNWRYASSSSGIVKAMVHPLGILDQAATPPYLYVVVLAAVVGVVLVVRWRVGGLSSRMPKPVKDLLAKLSRKPKARGAGATGRYRRREED
jgi:hypothetical protein